MNRPAPRPPQVPGPPGGQRAIATVVAAGFTVTTSTPGTVVGELRTVLAHPDGRRLEVLTTTHRGALIRARPLNRDRWPVGAATCYSVPGVERLLKLPQAT